MFRVADDDHGATAGLNNPFGDATQQQARELRMSLGPDHHQIDRFRFDVMVDLFDGVAVADIAGDFEPVPPVFSEGIELGGGPLLCGAEQIGILSDMADADGGISGACCEFAFFFRRVASDRFERGEEIAGRLAAFHEFGVLGQLPGVFQDVQQVQLGVKLMCQPCGVPHGVVSRSAKIGRHTNFADSKSHHPSHIPKGLSKRSWLATWGRPTRSVLASGYRFDHDTSLCVPRSTAANA